MDWRIGHKKVLEDFIRYLDLCTKGYILKGGTGLAVFYNLDRFSEDIDLDYFGDIDKESLFNIMRSFCEKRGYALNIKKDTDVVKRGMVHYGGYKPLKVELSLRNRERIKDDMLVLYGKGLLTYNINTMLIKKIDAYRNRDKIRDLYDICFIFDRYLDSLSEYANENLFRAFEYKGINYIDYVIQVQEDDLVNKDILYRRVLLLLEYLNLL